LPSRLRRTHIIISNKNRNSVISRNAEKSRLNGMTGLRSEKNAASGDSFSDTDTRYDGNGTWRNDSDVIVGSFVEKGRDVLAVPIAV
jgi:hypothetical protein